MANLTKGYTFGATEEVTAVKLHTLVDSGTVSNIVAADITDGVITDAKLVSVGGAKFVTLGSVPAGAGVIPAANLTSVAQKGANSDITSLSACTQITGMTTALSVAQGGTGITSSPLTTALGGTGATAAANAASGVVVLNASSQLPAVSGALLTGIAPGAGTITSTMLKTTTGEVNVSQAGVGGTSSSLVLPGGEYGFYPQTKTTRSTGSANIWVFVRLDCGSTIDSAGTITTTSRTTTANENYVTRIRLGVGHGTAGVTMTHYAQQRYITASGKDHWIFLLVDKITKQVIASYQAPDHPCANQGGAIELDIPHPFGSYDPVKHEIVLVDNEILNIAKTKINRRRSLLTVINEDFIIDDTQRPIFEPREIIKINEYPQEPVGKVINRIKTPQWAKIMIQSDEITLEQRIVEKLPVDILYKKLKLRGGLK